jgi:type IV secretory pathway VirB10-like protein
MLCDNRGMSTPKHPKRPADFNQRAYQVFQEAVGEAPPQPNPVQPEPTEKPPEREKDPAAVALGRKGGLKGGKARAEKLTAEERSEIGKKAAKARWGNRG